MFKLRLLYCLVGALLTAIAPQALDIITVNGQKVVAGSVVAKLKEPSDQAIRALSSDSVNADPISRTIPGLVELNKAKDTGFRALSAGDKAADLVQWIAELKATGLYEYVEPNFVYTRQIVPNDARFTDGSLWGLNNRGQQGGLAGADIGIAIPGIDIGITNAWDLTTGSTNIIVGVVDTGIRYTHRDLAAQMWINQDEIAGNGTDDDQDGYVDNIYGADPFNGDGDPDDDDGHGTHVAGTIGAAANDGNPHVGVAWNVRLMALKAGDGDAFSLAGIVGSIDFGIKNGVQIFNGSYGGYGYSQAQFDIINAARSAGILFVAAAGNDNNNNDVFPAYPASYNLDNIIAVAALDRGDQLADFSNYGNLTVDVGAPGVEILSTHNASDTAYEIFQGTSMASPHVAGVAALVAAYYPAAGYAEIRDRILDGVVRIPSLAGVTTTGGRVNVMRSLTGSADGIMEFTVIPTGGSIITINEDVLLSVSLADGNGPAISNATVRVTGPGINTDLPLVYQAPSTNNSPTAGTYTNIYRVPNVPGDIALTFSANAPGKNPLVEVVNFLAVSRPVNDHFRNALKVPNQQKWIHVSSNLFATIETNDFGRVEPIHGNEATSAASVWYSWSLPTRSQVIVDTAGSTPIDTVIAVYTGSALSNLVEVVSTNGPGNSAWVKFTAEPGVSYRIAVAGIPPAEAGKLQVRFEIGGEPDTVRPVIQIDNVVSGITVYTNKYEVRGTAYDPEPNASGIAELGIQYFASTTFEPNPGQLPTSAAGTTNWVAPIDLQEGINYFTVWARDNADNESFRKRVSLIYRLNPASNDIFANAQPLPLTENIYSDNNEGATKENLEMPHAGNVGGRSLWYRIQPSESGILLVNTRGSDREVDTLLAVYTTNLYLTKFDGPPFTNLVELASNDDIIGDAPFSEVTIGVEANRNYYIAVDGYDGDAGDIVLNYVFQPVSTFNVTARAGANGSINPSGTNLVFPRNAAVSFQAVPDEGYQFSHFRYFVGNDSGSAQSVFINPFTTNLNSNLTVEAVFTERVYTEGFDGAPRAGFELDGWTITDVADAGGRAAMSGPTGNNDSSSLIFRGGLAAGVGSFDFGVSSEEPYDRLEFYITDATTRQRTLVRSWSGEIKKQRFEFSIAAGVYELEWRYSKDSAFARGLDRAYVDNIDLPLASQPPPTGPVSIQNGAISWQPPVEAGKSYIIESSADLESWNFVTTFSAATPGYPYFYDPVGDGNRFYRIREQ